MLSALEKAALNEATKDAIALAMEPYKSIPADIAAVRTEMEKYKKAPAKALDPSGGMQLTTETTVDDVLRTFVKSNDPFKGKGLRFVQFYRAAAIAQMDHISQEQAAEKVLKNPELAAEISMIKTKQLGETTLAGGGALVPIMYTADMIEFLYPFTVVRRSGPLVIPLPASNLSIPKQTGTSTAYYLGENTAVLPSEQTFSQPKLNAKKLMALTPMSNDLLRDSNPAADIIVRNDLAMILGLREDLAFIRGNGTQDTPLGVLNAVNANNLIPFVQAGSVATLQEVSTFLEELQGGLEDNNVPLINMVFWMHPRSKRFLCTLRDGTGRFVYRDEIVENGTLNGYKLLCTTQIPDNLGNGYQSEIYLGSMAQLLIGDNLQMEVTVMPNGTWTDSSGVVVSGMSSDQTAIRVIAKHDLLLRHDFGFSVGTEVEWLA